MRKLRMVETYPWSLYLGLFGNLGTNLEEKSENHWEIMHAGQKSIGSTGPVSVLAPVVGRCGVYKV